MGMTFALYQEQQGGAPLWVETQNVQLDSTGHYSVLLGSTKSEGLPSDMFASNQAQWLGVRPEGQDELPRVLLVSVPYALKAGDAETLGGKPLSAFVLAQPSATANTIVTPIAITPVAQTGTTQSTSVTAKAVSGAGAAAASAPSQNFIPLFTDNAGTLGSSNMSQTAAGNIGIGFSNTSYERLVLASTPSGGVLNASNLVDQDMQIRLSNPGATDKFAYFGASTPTNLLLGVGGTEMLRINSMGNVGIGFNNPQSRLVIGAPAGGSLLNASNLSDQDMTISLSAPNAADKIAYFGSSTPTNLVLGVGGEKMRITGAGNVGIGTSAPTQKLTVAGTIQSTSGGFKFPDGTVLTSATNNSSVATSLVYAGTTTDQIVHVTQNQAGSGSFNASGVPSGVRGDSATTTGYGAGVFGSANSYQAAGVMGVNTSACNLADLANCDAYGVFGYSQQAIRGVGVWGQADAAGSGSENVGVYGQSAGITGTGIFGLASSTDATSDGVGVYGESHSPTGTGVYGKSTDVSTCSPTPCITTAGVYGLVQSTTGVGGLFDAPTGGNVIVGRSGSSNTFNNVFRVDATGKGYFNGGTVNSGADFAESIDALGGAAQYEPGDVMMIDETGSRRLALSSEAYSTKVAGIYSTKPGVLATPHAPDDPRIAKEVPLAIVGIVPCKVSAENGAIRAGDLLVTSSRPGYAMKGTDRSKMLGAVVGKALGSLPDGTGMIEVLVSLH
jgi:hypothetical protein